MLRPKRSLPRESTKHRAGDAGSNPPSPMTPEDLSDAPNSSAPPSSKAAADAAAVPPNPKRAKSSASPADAALGSGSAATSRSRRKRKPHEEFPQQQQKLQQKKVWEENDVEALLKAVVAFRSRTGALPRQATISEFFDGVKGSISPYITLEQVGYKLKRLKSKYINRPSGGLGSSATTHDRLVNKLSAEIWAAEVKPVVEEDGDVQTGQVDAAAAQAEEREDDEEKEGGEEDNEEEKEEDGAGEEEEEEYPFIREAAKKYWNELGVHYGAFVKNAMKHIDPIKGKSLEQKLKKQCEEETLLLAKRFDLLKDMSQMMVTASRSTKL